MTNSLSYTWSRKGQQYTCVIPYLHLLGALIGFCCLLGLGHWQWERARTKSSIIAQFAAAQQQPPVALPPPQHAHAWQAVRVCGQYQAHSVVLLANQYRNHQPGFRVLQRFSPASNEAGIWIDRGFWTHPILLQKASAIHEVLHTLPSAPLDPVCVEGLLQPAPSNWSWTPATPLLASVSHTQPLIVSTFSVSGVANGYNLVISLPAHSPGALLPFPPPSLRMTPEKHQAYAVQWLCMALAFLVFFAAAHTRKMNKERTENP